VVVLVTAVYVGIQQGVLTGPPASSTSTSTTTLTTVTSTSSGGVGSSPNGLQLQLRVNASSSAASHATSFQIRASEYNALGTANNVTAGNAWSINGLSLGACGTEAYPFGVALYRGSYTFNNASAATPLRIYPVVPCPMLIRYVSGYLFQPMSDLAVVLPSGPNGLTTPMSANLTASAEYSNGSSSSSTPLAPGTYTVAAGDEWGSVVLIHFTIGVGSSATSTATGTGTAGTLQAAFDVGPIQPVCSATATTGPAPTSYSSVEASISIQSDFSNARNFPITWLSNGCSASGSLVTTLAPGTYSLNVTPCQWMGCSNSLPKNFTITAGQSTTVKVSIDTGIR